VLSGRHPVFSLSDRCPSNTLGMGDGQRSEDTIPFTSRCQPAG
jgi:hypothetical protein